MDFKENSKPKKSILNTLLLKRSTKVEPHPSLSSFDEQSDHSQSKNNTNSNYNDHPYRQLSSNEHHNPFQTSVSASSTPIKRLHKIGRLNKFWHCHSSSNQSLASNHSAPSYCLRKISNNAKKKIRNKTDRYSHPMSNSIIIPDQNAFDAFYAVDDYIDDDDENNDNDDDAVDHIENVGKIPLNKNSVHFYSNGRLNVSHSISNEEFRNGGCSSHGGSVSGRGSSSVYTANSLVTSKSQEQIIVNDIDENVVCDLSKPQSPTSKSHDGNFAFNRDDLDFPAGHSIAMSACRSRLRERLLPPGYGNRCNSSSKEYRQHQKQQEEEEQQQHQQHCSFPNIVEKSTNPTSIEHRNSRSISCDLLPNAKRNGKTESLAKNSLYAAQLINLIPTEVARERTYLANNLAVRPAELLGPMELDRVLPMREIKVFVGTWNMNGQHPPKQMNDFVFPAGVEHVPDLVVIGTQESSSLRFEWEVILQETLGPSHVMLHATSLGTLHLAVFIRRDLIWYCSIPEDDCLSVRPGTAFRTKGAVAISFCLFGTSMLFVTSHLTAHQQKVKERVSDVKRIIHALDLPKNLHLRSKNKDVTQNFDAVFWCGDLNFRLGEPREKLLKWIETTQFPLPSHLPHGYMHTDQLKSVLANGAAFKDFKEANITFPPTYKYDPGTQKFDTSSKQRAPAYTDRILYKYKSNPFGLRRESNLTSFLHSAIVECIAYDSVPSIVSSDHKPVWALFKTCIKPGIDSIPLAAGLFNRDVYIEGMKRRLTKKTTESSNACCIQ